MKSVIASLVALAGLSGAAHGQAVMNMLVSTDGGVTWNSSVNALPGTHVEVLVTASYTGTNALVAGFGSSNFQPTVSNWDITGTGNGVDRLSAIGQGGNTAGGMINPQVYAGGGAAYALPTAGNGAHYTPGVYTPGTYGRVFPMGRTALDGPNAIQGFTHVNPDGSGQTYLRIAQANTPAWIGQPGNTSGGSGVQAAQLYVTNRTVNDPDFWGKFDTTLLDPTDPTQGFQQVPNGRSERLQNVQLFRFGMDLSTDTNARDLTVDAPVAGQQGYIGYYTSPNQNTPSLQLSFTSGTNRSSVVPGMIHVIPTPASLALLGMGGLVIGRRRR